MTESLGFWYDRCREREARIAELETELAGKPALICPACGAETRARLTDQEQLDRIAELEADVKSAVYGRWKDYEARIAELETDYANEAARSVIAERRLDAVIALCDERDLPGQKYLDFDEETERFRAAATTDPT